MTRPAPARPTPRQDRSRRTEQTLLDAALGLFLARGVEAVTVGDIAAAAGVAPATIYRRFGDKEGLLREAFARFTGNALQMLDLAPAPKPARSFVPLVADITALVWRFIRTHQPLLQSSYAKALADDFYAAHLVELRGRVFARLRDMFLQRADEIGHPQPELAVDFALRQAVAMLSARLEAGRLEVGDGAMDDALFVRELLRSILSYLQVPCTAQAIDRALTARGL
ncbi:MAG: TetR/AcrR family transcriptional regulator [Pseudomonadota bacterium]